MRLFLPCLLLFFGVHGAGAKGLIEQGRAILQADCSRCHAIGKTGFSPFKLAPPVRNVMKRYKVEDLAEGLSEGLVTGHPAMPIFEFEPDQIGAILAYLKSISPKR